MSVTIADLKYQNTEVALHRYMRDTFSWLYGFRLLDGIQGKTTMNSIGITGNLLVAADCVVDDIDTALASKEIDLDYYNLSFPIALCDLKETWLSGFANKYRDEKDVFIENLVPYLAEQIGDEVKAKVYLDILAEADADADAAEITLVGGITTPALTYATIIEFINGLSAPLIAEALDKSTYEGYSIDISPEAYKQVSIHLGDKVADYGVSVGGFRINGNSALTGNKMLCTSYRNKIVLFDDAMDLAEIKIVEKKWLSTSYIITGLGFKGSYADSSKIVISK